MLLGIDLGAVSSKALLLDDSFRLIHDFETPTKADFSAALNRLAAEFLDSYQNFPLRTGITGSGRFAFRFPAEALMVNDILALAAGTAVEFQSARSVIEVGAENSRWLTLRDNREQGLEREILDFALNEKCAAGCGAFLVQQASRLKLGIGDFSALAASAERGSSIAGRCSVIAKTDMIHLQQKGVPLDEIAYGVSLALARNFGATVLKGRECPAPVLFMGGVASNAAVVRAFANLLGRPVTVHPYNRISGAIGAVLLTRESLACSGKTFPPRNVLNRRISGPHRVSSFECRLCQNMCQVSRIAVDREEIYFGDTCERYTSRQFEFAPGENKVIKPSSAPDAFEERNVLFKSYAAGWEAQNTFKSRMKNRGREILEASATSDEPLLALIGRPYNLNDSFLNMNLSRHLRKLRALALPMEYLPCDEIDLGFWPGAPPWRYNQHILKATIWCAQQENVYPVILSNFGCGLDAFTLRHVEKILG
jgi:predicted CoA-substrate-specific enzyme activase